MTKLVLVAMLLSGSFLVAQDSATDGHHGSKNEVTVQGCVGRSNGDYVLTKQDPAITYELQATGKTRLKNYLGQRVEVSGNSSPTLSSSSDATSKMGSAAPVTITITSIKTIDKSCVQRQASE
jgi:hypothetical protein